MSAVQQLATLIATAVRDARSTVGMAEIATVSGNNVVTNRGSYAYDVCCPVDIYDGKQVWVQVTEDGNAVIIGD